MKNWKFIWAMKFIYYSETCVSRSMIRSADILGSMPVEQCLAIALFSSDCMVKGGSIPVGSYINWTQS